jgi:hypothetical protein
VTTAFRFRLFFAALLPTLAAADTDTSYCGCFGLVCLPASGLYAIKRKREKYQIGEKQTVIV